MRRNSAFTPARAQRAQPPHPAKSDRLCGVEQHDANEKKPGKATIVPFIEFIGKSKTATPSKIAARHEGNIRAKALVYLDIAAAHPDMCLPSTVIASDLYAGDGNLTDYYEVSSILSELLDLQGQAAPAPFQAARTGGACAASRGSDGRP